MTVRPPIPPFRTLLPAVGAALVRFLFAGVVPILTFYVLLRVYGPTAGIAGGMVVSVSVLLVQLRRLKRLDPIVIVPMALILIQGTVALALGSVELYLAAPAVENFLWGVVLLGSLVVRRPLVRLVAGELNLIPTDFAGSTTLRRALMHVTLAWGLGAFAKAGVRLWLLTLLPLEAFLVAITLFHFVLNGALIAFSLWWPFRTVKRGHEVSGAPGSRLPEQA